MDHINIYSLCIPLLLQCEQDRENNKVFLISSPAAAPLLVFSSGQTTAVHYLNNSSSVWIREVLQECEA